VVFALVRREILTRFGHSRLGYIWALLQPLVLVTIMYFVFAILHRRLPTGVTPIGFLLTGFMSFMFFSETRNRVGQSLRGNLALLHFRQVTLFSLILGRVTLEFLTSLSISAMLVLMSALIGETVDLDNPFLILWGIVMLTLFGMEFGIIVVAFSKLIPAIEHISHGINRILFLVSGIWFYANELPQTMRDFFLLNPIFNVLEIIRDGYFKGYTAHYASMIYVHECVLVGGFLALSLKRILYHRLIDNRN
jgi:capsular polysaccharide transport system permease protein